MLDSFYDIEYRSRMDVALQHGPAKAGVRSESSGRYEPLTRESIDWLVAGGRPAAARHHRHRRVMPIGDHPKQLAGRAVRSLAESLSRPRARLRLLLRPATACYLGLSPVSTSRRSCSPSRTRRDCWPPTEKAGLWSATNHARRQRPPFQPIERRRGSLAASGGAREFPAPGGDRHQVGAGSARLDILEPTARRRLVSVGLSITSLDPQLARVMERRASTPSRRLAAVRALSDAGVPVEVMTAPLIPLINDDELEQILEAGGSGRRVQRQLRAAALAA